LAGDKQQDQETKENYDRPNERCEIGVDIFDADFRKDRRECCEYGGQDCPYLPGLEIHLDSLVHFAPTVARVHQFKM
jgi:hypothetical protein